MSQKTRNPNGDKTVLIVEDEIALQEAIKAKLERVGFKTVTARKVEQAINLLEDLDGVDAIWLDHYLLGERSGLDFVGELKKNEKWKSIPVFVVSNTASDEKVETYIRLGVNKYFVKSDNRLDEIIEDIEKVVKK